MGKVQLSCEQVLCETPVRDPSEAAGQAAKLELRREVWLGVLWERHGDADGEYLKLVG